MCWSTGAVALLAAATVAACLYCAAAWPTQGSVSESDSAVERDNWSYDGGVVGANGCHTLDHAACDDRCKRDNFWYGHCNQWDGSSFGCTCFNYKRPLRSDACSSSRQKRCDSRCRVKGNFLGGYCYPHPTDFLPTGEPRCRCFELSSAELKSSWG